MKLTFLIFKIELILYRVATKIQGDSLSVDI